MRMNFVFGAAFTATVTLPFISTMCLAQAVPPATLSPGARTAPAPAPAATAAPLPPPAPMRQAFEKAATDVLQNAKIADGTRVELLIDPLVDGNTGAQSNTTRSIEQQLRQLVAARFRNKFEIKPFTSDNVAKAPFVFIGTFTPIHAVAQAIGARDAYRICFAIVDLRSKLIVSKGFARATPDGVSAIPTPAFADSPIWIKDPAVDGYVRTCQGTKVGDPINPAYLERIGSATLISDAIQAYDNRRYQQAFDLYTRARAQAGGDQLRVHNGLYLSSLKLNKRAEAQKALDDLVDFGLKGERLGVMLLFAKNGTNFVPGAISQNYSQWLKTISDKTAARNACLHLVGHASHSGPEAWNNTLSANRAEAVRTQLGRFAPQLAAKLATSGVGWRENIIGTGKDNASDALDRRVEFKVAGCS